MNSFLRAFIGGLAALFLVMAAAIMTVGMASGGDVRAFLRKWVLNEEELAVLRAEEVITPRQPPARDLAEQSKDAMLEELANRVSSSQVKNLVNDLKRREKMLQEQQSYADQRQAELRIAESDLLRRQKALQDERARVDGLIKNLEGERNKWAVARTNHTRQIRVLGEIEKQRLRDQALIFEAMGKNAWDSLRRFTPIEIARYLAFMEPKKAADILKRANADNEMPNVAYEIHRSWKHLDLDAVSSGHLQHLAELYSFMRAEEIAPNLIEDGSVANAAIILDEILVLSGEKRVAAVLTALRSLDADFEQRLIRYQNAGGNQQ